MKKLKWKILICAILTLTISTYNEISEKVITQEYEQEVSPISIVDINGVLIEDELQFKFTLQNDSNVTKIVKTKDGKLEDFKLNGYDSYTITLSENSNYEMEPIKDFNLMFGQIERITVIKKEKSEEVLDGFEVPTISVVDEKNQLVTDELKFKFTNHNDETDTITVKSKNGKIESLRLKSDMDSYTITLLENSNYEMKVFEDFNLLFGGVDSLIVTKKEFTPIPNEDPKLDDSDDCEECKVYKVYDDISVVSAKDDKIVNRNLTFFLYDITNSRQEAKFIKKVISENGVIKGLKLEVNKLYRLSLEENEGYVMNNLSLFSNQNFSNPLLLIGMNGENLPLAKILIDEKTKDESDRYTVYLPVYYNSDTVKDGITFKFVTDSETLVATTKGGYIRVRVKDKFTYMVNVENEMYDIVTFPLTIKEKDLVGKLPFDYRNCHPLEFFNLKLKSSIMEFKPKENSDGSVSVSGMNFDDLLLIVNKVENTNENLLNKDVNIFDISFKNTLRDEIVDLIGDFTVRIRKEKGKNVSDVYHIRKDKSLESMEIVSQDEEFVTFKTSHFSEYVLKYGKNRDIPAEKLLELQKEGAIIIDVRLKEQYDAGHIDGSINIPLSEFEKGISKYVDSKDKKIVLYCNSGNQSRQALNKLLNAGYYEVYNAPGVKQYNYNLVKTKDDKKEKNIDEKKDEVIDDKKDEITDGNKNSDTKKEKDTAVECDKNKKTDKTTEIVKIDNKNDGKLRNSEKQQLKHEATVKKLKTKNKLPKTSINGGIGLVSIFGLGVCVVASFKRK